jgi:hypothetical protein
LVAAQHVAAGEAAGIAEAGHDFALLVHVVEIDAGRRVLIGEQRPAVQRIGAGCRCREHGNYGKT